MNPLFAAVVGTVVVAAVPPLRRRVVPVGSAVAGGAVALAESTVEGVSGVVGAVAGGVAGVAEALVRGERPEHS